MNLKNQYSSTNVSKVLNENRYCNQESNSFLACCEKDRNKNLTKSDLEITVYLA